ncbi:unnamed protein product [Trichobilharzia szidati]|nr:unnamed protein product [Trichobilharzia szidati]CAH8853049.1 unnamed protein product [Trichobilharzia szidati]
MSDEVISCLEKYILNFGVCKCCALRLTKGYHCQPSDLLSAFHSQSYSKDYVCKICFGLLHHSLLCDMPLTMSTNHDDDGEKYALVYLYKKIIESKYQFTAYQLRVTEPVNITIREQFLWDELLSLINNNNNISNSSDKHVNETQNGQSFLFTHSDISTLRSHTVPVKTVWKWIVEPKLSELLKAPVIYSLRNDTELKSIKTNGLHSTNPNHDQESNIMCISVEFSQNSIQSDFNALVNYLEKFPSSYSIHSFLVRLKNSKIPRKRSRFNFTERIKATALKQHKEDEEIINDEEDNEAKDVLMEDNACSLVDNNNNNNDSDRTHLSISNQPTSALSSVINIGYTLDRSCQFSRTVLTELSSLLKDVCLHSDYIKKRLSEDNHSLAFMTLLNISRSIPLCLAGRYVKLSRRLPQTPWLIGTQRKLDSSVEELITGLILPEFGANAQSCFMSSGREDVDVRCLGLGRPFVIEINNYAVLPSEIVRKWSINNNAVGAESIEIDPSQSLDLLKLASLVNSNTQDKVYIRDLQLVSSATASAKIKGGEMQKAKCYRALCWCPNGGITTEMLMKMEKYAPCIFIKTAANSNGDDNNNNSSNVIEEKPVIQWPCSSSSCGTKIGFGPFEVNQLTPLRVLHRRALMTRKRAIHHVCFMSYKEAMQTNNPVFDDFKSWSKLYSEDELFLLELRCEAGTYVKEFVHGDLGRCNPSLASIFECHVDILALDVISVELDWPKRLQNPFTL